MRQQFIDKLKANPLPVIFFTVFIDLIGFGILIPVIPLLLADPAYKYYLLPAGYTVKHGFILLGYLTAIFPFMQFLATPILGQLSDRFGRKNILALSLFGTCLSYIIFAIGIISKNLPLLFIARGFDGITGGNIAVAQASIADITTPQNRAKNFGLIGAAFGLGFIMGPYIGGKLSDPSVVSWFSATTPFWFAAILSFLNVCSILFFFPETLKEKRYDLHITWNKSVKNIIKAYSMPEVRMLFVTNFLFQGGFTFFTTFFSIFLISRFHFTQGNIGDFFSFVGLNLALAQAILTRKILHIFADYEVLRMSIIMSGVAIGMYFLPVVWWGILLVVPIFAIYMGLSQASITGLVSRSVGPQMQGEILGINASVQALAQTMPPILSGYIAASLAPEAPIFVAATIVIIAGVFFNIFYKPHFPSITQASVQAPAEEEIPPSEVVGY